MPLIAGVDLDKIITIPGIHAEIKFNPEVAHVIGSLFRAMERG